MTTEQHKVAQNSHNATKQQLRRNKRQINATQRQENTKWAESSRSSKGKSKRKGSKSRSKKQTQQKQRHKQKQLQQKQQQKKTPKIKNKYIILKQDSKKNWPHKVCCEGARTNVLVKHCCFFEMVPGGAILQVQMQAIS